MAGPCRIPKLTVRVRFPSPAPHTKSVAAHTNLARIHPLGSSARWYFGASPAPDGIPPPSRGERPPCPGHLHVTRGSHAQEPPGDPEGSTDRVTVAGHEFANTQAPSITADRSRPPGWSTGWWCRYPTHRSRCSPGLDGPAGGQSAGVEPPDGNSGRTRTQPDDFHRGGGVGGGAVPKLTVGVAPQQ